jgi:hypothetical protein
MFKRSAARALTSPFAVFVSWTIDLAVLLRALRRQRRWGRSGGGPGGRSSGG